MLGHECICTLTYAYIHMHTCTRTHARTYIRTTDHEGVHEHYALLCCGVGLNNSVFIATVNFGYIMLQSYHGNGFSTLCGCFNNIYCLYIALQSSTHNQYSCKAHVVGTKMHGKILDGEYFWVIW